MLSAEAKGRTLARLAVSSILMLVFGGIAVHAQERVLVNFPPEYSSPSESLVSDATGNLFGGIAGGTSSPDGAIFELSPTSTGARKAKLLVNFKGPNGNWPQTQMIFDGKGNLYGATYLGGNGSCTYAGKAAGCGLVFELSRNSSGIWSEKVLYQFQGGNDGFLPYGNIAFDSAGNLYGTTQEAGGTGCFDSQGCGVVYQLKPSISGQWTEQILYRFTGGNDGSFPGGVAVSGSTVYGTTEQNGASGAGNVFSLKQSSGAWNFSIVYSFPGGTAGGNPNAAVTVDSSGNIYGSAVADGQYGWGNVFKLTPSSSGWTETVLYNFTGGSDGASAVAPPILDSAGNLYGTTFTGGEILECGWQNPDDGCGVVFKLTPPAAQGNPWTETVLHEFSFNGTDGVLPFYTGVVFGKGGLLYGVTAEGGTGQCIYPPLGTNVGCGTVYAVKP